MQPYPPCIGPHAAAATSPGELAIMLGAWLLALAIALLAKEHWPDA